MPPFNKAEAIKGVVWIILKSYKDINANIICCALATQLNRICNIRLLAAAIKRKSGCEFQATQVFGPFWGK